MPLDVEDVSIALEPHSKTVHEPKLAAGDVYIFRGHKILSIVYQKLSRGNVLI